MTHVIVCSNSTAVVDTVSRAFGQRGGRLTVCESGLELLSATRALAADLVVLDLETPGLSSLFLVSAIRELAPGLPLVAVSTRPDVDAQALTQKGVPYALLGSGDVPPLLAELARDGRGQAAARAGLA